MRRVVIFLLLIGSGCAFADVIASWDVDGVDVADGTGIDESSSPYAFTAPSFITGISDAKLKLSTAVNPSTSADQYGLKISSGEGATNLVEAISFQQYIEISISVSSGYTLNLDSIEMNAQASATGWTDAVFMSSVAGYTAGNELDSVNGVNATGGMDTDSSGWGAPIDLSGAAYQGLTGTTTFRIYGWGSTSGSGVSYIRNLSGDDFVINGSVVPEPATMSLIGIAGLLMMLSRRIKLRNG